GQIAAGDTLTFNIGGKPTTFAFHNGGTPPSTGVAIDLGGKSLSTVVGEMQAALRDTGGAASGITLAVGAGSMAIDLGSDLHASFTISGDAADDLGIAGTSSAPTRPIVR